MLTHDTAGKRVLVTTGLTTNHKGQLVAAMAIGDGATAILLPDMRINVAVNMLETIQDAETEQARIDNRKGRP